MNVFMFVGAIRSPELHLAIGSIIDCKDCNNKWYPAKIIRANVPKMLVKVHYINWPKKWDEWIRYGLFQFLIFVTASAVENTGLGRPHSFNNKKYVCVP